MRKKFSDKKTKFLQALGPRRTTTGFDHLSQAGGIPSIARAKMF
jgi:hypothetical protein